MPQRIGYLYVHELLRKMLIHVPMRIPPFFIRTTRHHGAYSLVICLPPCQAPCSGPPADLSTMPLIHDISFHRPKDVPPYENFDCYMIILETVFHDYRHTPFDTADVYKQRAEMIANAPYSTLVYRIELKFYDRLALELGVRCETST